MFPAWKTIAATVGEQQSTWVTNFELERAWDATDLGKTGLKSAHLNSRVAPNELFLIRSLTNFSNVLLLSVITINWNGDQPKTNEHLFPKNVKNGFWITEMEYRQPIILTINMFVTYPREEAAAPLLVIKERQSCQVGKKIQIII